MSSTGEADLIRLVEDTGLVVPGEPMAVLESTESAGAILS